MMNRKPTEPFSFSYGDVRCPNCNSAYVIKVDREEECNGRMCDECRFKVKYNEELKRCIHKAFYTSGKGHYEQAFICTECNNKFTILGRTI
jgi:transposase-like protein